MSLFDADDSREHVQRVVGQSHPLWTVAGITQVSQDGEQWWAREEPIDHLGRLADEGWTWVSLKLTHPRLGPKFVDYRIADL